MTLWTEGVSVILPTHNDAAYLPGFFKNLNGCEVLEVLLCDCGSTDDSVVIGRESGAHVFRGNTSLRETISGGAQHARGSVLWFLSPLCRPPRLAGPYILGSFDLPRIQGGYFLLRSTRRGMGHWWREKRVNLAAEWRGKVSILNGPYVDRDVFEDGGFPSGPFASWQLMQRANQVGKIFVMPDPIIVCGFRTLDSDEDTPIDEVKE